MGEYVPIDVAQRCADFDMKKAGPLGVFLKSIRMETRGNSVVVDLLPSNRSMLKERIFDTLSV